MQATINFTVGHDIVLCFFAEESLRLWGVEYKFHEACPQSKILE